MGSLKGSFKGSCKGSFSKSSFKGPLEDPGSLASGFRSLAETVLPFETSKVQAGRGIRFQIGLRVYRAYRAYGAYRVF